MIGCEPSGSVAALPFAMPMGIRDASSDTRLVRAAQRGSEDAAEALVRRYWPEAHHAAYLIVREAKAAEDIAQESIIAALSSLGRFDRRRPFRPWLHRIVANRAIDWQRSRARRSEVALEAAASSAEGGFEPPLAGELGEALSQLDPETRAMVVLRYLLDFRSEEIGEMLGLEPGAVRTRLHRALRRLRKSLEERAP
jgi:RNA polymerase sigma-70 factor, ECF subfamily